MYAGLVVFVALVGGTILAVPQLRHRLLDRIQVLKSAAVGDVKPVSAQVGENHEPFPEEFVLKAPPVPTPDQLPAGVFSQLPSREGSSTQPIGKERPPLAARRGSKPPVLIREQDSGEPADSFPMESSESGPQYKQGRIEQDAYDLVLKSNKSLAEMIQGSNPSLHFKSWDVAHRGEDVYWVRVTFQGEGKQDVRYIWQVILSTGEITPLSFNARSLF